MAEFSEIRKHIFNLNFKKQEGKEIYIKIAVLGKMGVGKSSLTYRYINNEFPAVQNDTIEDRIVNQAKIEDKLYKIEILDTAGEDDYPQMLDMWVNYAEGFLLVFAINDKNSFDLIPEKRDHIIEGKQVGSYPMILVGNKQDLTNNREVSYDDAKQLADSWNIDYIETSAKTNFNCKETFEQLAVKIYESRSKIKGLSCPCSIYQIKYIWVNIIKIR